MANYTSANSGRRFLPKSQMRADKAARTDRCKTDYAKTRVETQGQRDAAAPRTGEQVGNGEWKTQWRRARCSWYGMLLEGGVRHQAACIRHWANGRINDITLRHSAVKSHGGICSMGILPMGVQYGTQLTAFISWHLAFCGNAFGFEISDFRIKKRW